ncbi:MAG: Eco57I restriction-modification methylase domain-containing protein, partial [Gemmatimonadales bacterium]
RRRDGTFFTPPALVREILRQAVACHLAPRLSRTEEAVDGSLDDPDPELQRALIALTVLDPAVGSGAFLVEALRLLHGPGEPIAARVRLLVTRRLFGVDRHPGAVRVCELRLWLEVLRAMRGRGTSDVTPLPNLDAAVRAGDALIDPLHGRSLDGPVSGLLAGDHRALERAHGAAKRGALAAMRHRERRAIERELLDREAALDLRIAEFLEARRTPTLFGNPAPPTRTARLELERLRHERSEVRHERRRITRDTAAAPFAIAAAFAPVVAQRGGFDLVVGNPPWVRAERLPPATRQTLALRYRWWRSGGGAGRTGWRHLPDLSIAFAERAFELLAPGGTLALLLPAKIATTAYAQSCRGALAERATLHRVADLGKDPRAGFDATTYPLALIASRRAPAPGHMVRLGLTADAPAESQAAWRNARRWSLSAPAAQRVAERLAVLHPPLSERVAAQLGVKTGANVAFLDPPPELHEYCRMAIRGRDLRPFRIAARIRLLWPADDRGRPWPSLPGPVRRYLSEHLDRLRHRADSQRGPWWSLFRTGAATAAHRVAWRDLARRLEAAAVEDPMTVPLNSCYVAAVPSAEAACALAAWLNATPIRALARLAAEPAAGGCARFAARAIGGLPLPRRVLADAVLAGLAHAGCNRDVQAAIDERAEDLLELSAPDAQSLRDVAADCS